MRYFFLVFIALLTAIGNAAIFESFALGRAIGGIAFNLFILSLLVIWWSSYFSGAFAKARGLVVGHALLMLSAGIGFAVIGANAALANSCESFISSNRSQGLSSQFATYVQSLGYCRELGFGAALLGLFVAYPSIRLFVGITRRSSGPPSASAEL